MSDRIARHWARIHRARWYRSPMFRKARRLRNIRILNRRRIDPRHEKYDPALRTLVIFLLCRPER